MPRNHILVIWRKKFYGVYPIGTITQHPVKRSYRQPPRKLGRLFWRYEEKSLWSLPCPYDNPTPSEAVWNAEKSYFGEVKKKVLWSLPCPYDNPTPSEAILPPPSQARQAIWWFPIIYVKEAIYFKSLDLMIVKNPLQRFGTVLFLWKCAVPDER